MGTGPQLPSNITKMIKYGVNLLQVFGEFDGQYIIALAFMNKISSPDPSQLQDYLRPMSDCAIIEMSSRISLYCPISQHRIKTPVKGHLCKHHQCFDYIHFIEVNSTKPTWTCPICNNPVCNQDLRIDQDFLKILNEVAEDVHDVIISEDGSWMVAETEMDTTSHTTVTTPVVSVGQTQVLCTNNQAHNTIAFTPPAGSFGQTQVNSYTANQGQSSTIFTPPAAETKPEVSSGQALVNGFTSNQRQSTMFTTTQTTSTPMFTPPATVKEPPVSPCQTQVNVYTTTQTVSAPLFTPPATVKDSPASPDETLVNVCTTTQTPSTPIFTPPATVKEPPVSPGQTHVNVFTTTQTPSTPKFTPPATVKEPPVSPGQTQVNVCTSTQPLSTPMFTQPASGSTYSFAQASNELRKGGNLISRTTTPGESHSAPNISQVPPAQLLEASGDGMPSGRMRGSLRGDKLEAARLQYLAPPQQPARANEPWSRPPGPSLPLPFMMPKPPTNSHHV